MGRRAALLPSAVTRRTGRRGNAIPTPRARWWSARARTAPAPTSTGIAEVCHDRGKPLIVDEAWGAHLPFHEDLPTWAMDAGADVCVVSVHKMGAGFEQGSVFHVQGDLIDGTGCRRVRTC